MTEDAGARARAPEVVKGRLPIWTLPNLFSLSRILFLVPILWLLHDDAPGSDGWALAILIVAGTTDLIDGWLARRKGAISPSGKLIDPLADKILLGGLVLWLALAREFPLWLVGAVLARDLALVLGAWIFLRRERIVFAADWTGKLTTFFLGQLVLAHIAGFRWAWLPLTVLAALALLASCVSYGSRLFRWRAAVAGRD